MVRNPSLDSHAKVTWSDKANGNVVADAIRVLLVQPEFPSSAGSRHDVTPGDDSKFTTSGNQREQDQIDLDESASGRRTWS